MYISTDEVYGALKKNDPVFNEKSMIQPNNPYSATKAAGDHLIRAYYKTYGLPTLTLHLSNCYGPRQHTEKLIPKTIQCIINDHNIPVYGEGKQIRDWNFVGDAVKAIYLALKHGQVGDDYIISGENEVANIDLVTMLLALVPELAGKNPRVMHSLVDFVTDRPGHDYRYASSNEKFTALTGWKPETPLKKDFVRQCFGI